MPIPEKFWGISIDPPSIKTSVFIKERLKMGQAKKCGCGVVIGMDYAKCGLCMEKDSFKRAKQEVKRLLNKR